MIYIYIYWSGGLGVPRTVIGSRARERNGRVPGSSLDPTDDQVGSTEIWRPHLFANFQNQKWGARPSGVAELAVVGLLDTRWQLNVDPSESHWSVLDPGAWEGTGMDGPGSRWAGSDEWAGRGRLLGVRWTPLTFKWARLGSTGINRVNWHMAAQCAGQLAERSGEPSVVDRFQNGPPRTRNKWAGGGAFAGFN